MAEREPSLDEAEPVWRRATHPSWLFPFRGIAYFASHRFLWPLLRSRLIPCLLLSLTCLVMLFVWTYVPQALLLLPFHGHAAFFNAAILVLGEGATLTALLFEAFFVDSTLADVFDAVLIDHGCTALVEHGRHVQPATDPVSIHPPEAAEDGLQNLRNPVERLGEPFFSLVYSPFSLVQILEFILLLPLNLVPYIGVPCFLLLTGARGGPFHHHRYFRLRGLTKKERRSEIQSRSLRYTWFGTSALILQLVPGLSMLFLLTTAAGSALWVVELEERRNRRLEQSYDTLACGPAVEYRAADQRNG